MRTPKLYWSPQMDRVSIDGETLVLSQFRSGIQDLIADTISLLDRLTGGKRFATKLPEDFRDDLPNTTRGYSFLDHGPFTDYPNAYLRFLVQESEWNIAFLDDEGHVAWNMPSLYEIMDLFAQLNSNLMMLHFVMVDNRGTQLADQQIRNALQPRNIYHPLRSMICLTRRTKTSNLTGHDSCIPGFIPPIVEEITVEYLAGGIREVEELFSHITHSPESAALYHT
jgi:hypothetical protein